MKMILILKKSNMKVKCFFKIEVLRSDFPRVFRGIISLGKPLIYIYSIGESFRAGLLRWFVSLH